MHRAQTATEYLVIISVVTIIALIVISTLGGIPGIGSNAKVSAWASNPVISISSYSVTEFGTILEFFNVHNDLVTINQIFVDNQTYNTSLFLNVGQKRKVLLPYPFANGTDYRYRVSLNYTDSKTNARYYISKPELVIEGKGGRYALSNIPLYNSLAFYVRADANAVDLLGGLAASFGTNTSTGLSARRGSTFGATGGGAGAISYGLGTTTNTSFSMALFVNPNGCNGGGPLMAKRSFIFFDDNYGCRSANNGFQCRVGSSEVESFGSCSAGIWQHLALTYNSQNGLISVYVNGALINSTTEYGSFASNANPLRFNYDAGAGSGNSQYSDAYVFNRTLSAADINQLYSEVFTLN